MAPIDVLPDDVLLAIFDFCVDQNFLRQYIYEEVTEHVEMWQALVHVCRRWRTIVFGSPLRLDLALVCTAKTPARDTLDVWPPLPLVILSHGYYRTNSDFPIEWGAETLSIHARRPTAAPAVHPTFAR